MSKLSVAALVAVAVLATSAALFDIYTQYHYCKEIGGTLVRGLIGVVCIK